MAEVYLSPSSQSFNKGYGGFGTEENRMNFIANIVEYELARNGITTDRNNPQMSLTEIVADANAKAPTIYVALQSQSANGLMRGAELFHYQKGDNSERLALDINDYISIIYPVPTTLTDGSLAYGGLGFYELRKTQAPAVIVAVGFHDNPDDSQFIIDNTYEIGVAIVKGILQYLGVPYTEDNPESIEKLKAEYNGITL